MTSSMPPSFFNTLIKSKTFWINTAALVLAAIPPVTEWIIANGMASAGILAILNILSKGLTAILGDKSLPNEQIEEREVDPDDSSSSQSSGSNWHGIMLILLVGSTACLNACGHAVPPNSSFLYEQNQSDRNVTIYVERWKF